MTDSPPNEPENDEYPSLDHAYDFVLPSVEWTVQRFTAIETRIQQLTGLIATVTVAVPIAISALEEEANLRSGWLIATVALGIGGILMGALAQTLGSLQLLRVDRMARSEYLKRNPEVYRRSVVATAGHTQEVNRRRIQRRAWVAVGLVLVLAGELVLLVVWFFCG